MAQSVFGQQRRAARESTPLKTSSVPRSANERITRLEPGGTCQNITATVIRSKQRAWRVVESVYALAGNLIGIVVPTETQASATGVSRGGAAAAVAKGVGVDTSAQSPSTVAWRHAPKSGVSSVIRRSDTAPDAAAIQSRVIERLTVEQRLELAFEMSQMARALARARLREEHADWGERDLDRELLRLAFLPDDLPPGL